jgi:hypothetical protein
MLSRDEAIKKATERGLIVKPGALEYLVSVRTDKVPPDNNERMRITASGNLLIVEDGYYWQVGTTDDLIRWMEEKA